MDLSFVSCYVYLLNTVSTYIVAISSYWDDIEDVIISTIISIAKKNQKLFSVFHEEKNLKCTENISCIKFHVKIKLNTKGSTYIKLEHGHRSFNYNYTCI